MSESRLIRGLWIVRRGKVGSGPRDETKEPTTADLIRCACCGQAIKNYAELSNGDRVGLDCANEITNGPALGWKPKRKVGEYKAKVASVSMMEAAK